MNRIAAAIIGGYLFASSAGALLSALYGPGSDAMLGGALLGLALYAPAIIWAFATHSARRAWAGLLGASFSFAVLAVVAGASS
ncbi:DUF3649 domain-containing protein [Pseudoduganella sp. FT26W]|uniref:DUF3649 domain-containing protein n=1 Tax=Duganella aquatilis TaxID=2666082 RepID=A0A844D6Z3_9BURK|nr:DUF3649 domain-containing protein [Duganella aquatilis]MRW82989.1 DUF3649 domain-containing protein [Duganella aquatilis]